MPLHFHMLINVPDQGLDWFDARYQTVWEQILRANNVKGDIYSDSIGDKEKLAGYSLKQLDIEWVFDRTLWPIDLLKYTGTSS